MQIQGCTEDIKGIIKQIIVDKRILTQRKHADMLIYKGQLTILLYYSRHREVKQWRPLQKNRLY